MKKFGLILAVCLAFIGFNNAHAEDVGDTARAAVRHTSATTTNTTSNRPRPSTTNSTTTRTANTATNHNARTASTPVRTNTNVVERKSPAVSARTTSNVVPRVTLNSTATRTTPRSVTRTATSGVATNRAATRTIARAATGTVTREDIMTRDYSKCKTVFFDCMDEFCANKDAQLKRCACSSRINEFNSVKKQLAAAEEKMLDFNQRLLTVSMDKEDAEALSVATEGEEAYLGTKDKSASKRTLDEIAKKLNTSFDTNNFNTSMNALSWSLDIDAAFDTVDSLRGASTTAKSGTALYSAALPVCREMAGEVCAQSDISLAEGGYLALIEQDCNTVAQTYQSQVDQARTKVMEGNALLDMSRLDIYQKRNSDDILTCKKKMLDMLANSTVCGTGLSKCLDISGKYIDPSTGEAFLDPELIELGGLLTRPTGNETWSSAGNNDNFVRFLNSKKKFLEPAMEQCQDIADSVWNSFIDDALSQIKLAQDKKLEEVRQSCTTLTSQCLTGANKSIVNFDARALSTFGIAADITANAMCKKVVDTCTDLFANDTTADWGGDTWTTGVSAIQLENTYKTLMDTCRQVGQACIIQVCTSVSGNFGLCESISNSTNRKTIINHTACWDQVKECIASAGDDKIAEIIDTQEIPLTDNEFYEQMYSDGHRVDDNVETCKISGSTNRCVHKMCADECTNTNSPNCRTCRLAEKIWGNCEVPPTTSLSSASEHNQIRIPKTGETGTLLSWFAVNTGTKDEPDSCRDTTCGVGYLPFEDFNTKIISCKTKDEVNGMCFANYYTSEPGSCTYSITPYNNAKCQCCPNQPDASGNCCQNKTTSVPVYDDNKSLCLPTGETTVMAASADNSTILLCVGTLQDNDPYCNGTLVVVTTDGNGTHYKSPTSPDYVTEHYMSQDGQCTYNGTSWGSCATPQHWTIVYDEL